MVCDFDYNIVKIRPDCQSNAALTDQDASILLQDIFGSIESAEEGSGFAEPLAHTTTTTSPDVIPGIDGASKSDKFSNRLTKEGKDCSYMTNTVPHLAHETDCSKFYHCIPNHGMGAKFALKNCSPGTLFNPKNLICDWPLNVYKFKPICKEPGD